MVNLPEGYNPLNDWQCILTPPLFVVNCNIAAGDTVLSLDVPNGLPENCVVRIMPAPLQPNFLEPKVGKEPNKLTFTLPIALPTPVQFQAFVFGYTAEQVASLQRYAKYVAEELKAPEVVNDPVH